MGPERSLENKRQRWEYMTLYAYTRGEGYKVMAVNDKQIGDVKPHGLFGLKAVGESLYEFLNKAGEEGWDVVGISPGYSEGSVPHRVPQFIILKRPKN